MACKKCGGGRPSADRAYPVFVVNSIEMPNVTIGAKSSILLEGIANEQVFLPVGKTLKISNTAATDLQEQGAPIWIL